MRQEQIIFNELADLCSFSGYAHAIAHFSFRDNTILISDSLTSEDMQEQYGSTRLIRTEISTLIGLMVKNEIDLSFPNQDNLENMINQTETLLYELHDYLSYPQRAHLQAIGKASEAPSFDSGAVLREPIFYGGESAYDFQYLSFALQKYANDNAWLQEKKGFTIELAVAVVSAIKIIQEAKILSHLVGLRDQNPENWTMLPAFIFTVDELLHQSHIEKDIIENVLKAFSLPKEDRNDTFNSLNDFNRSNACPLIKLDDDRYLLFQHYSLVEALYESPFYWMYEDSNYLNQANKNRGVFLERFSTERLKLVFGGSRVFPNVEILESAKPKKGMRNEIDTLVVFGNKAIILQAKSKRLSLGARKGNDKVIKDDFQKGIQNSYDQGLLCAKRLSDINNILIDSDGNKINIQTNFSEIYIICLVSDHYPALSTQSHQFLKYEETKLIMPPFVMDIFCLDVITEMLQSPLYLLSYISRRTKYVDKIIAFHEITVLAFYIKHNPWLDDDQFIYLDGNVSSEIDMAMTVRRLGVPGVDTPDGALTQLANTLLGKILQMIERIDDPIALDLGLLLLTLGSKTIDTIEKGLGTIIKKSRKDKNPADLSISIGGKQTGLTVHCNRRPYDEAMESLQGHCGRRKYKEKAEIWYGLCISPENGGLRFVIKGEYPWSQSNIMDVTVEKFLAKTKTVKLTKAPKKIKIGVNKPCPCGSGLKFKKCCN